MMGEYSVINDGWKYRGEWVATRGFDDKEVICHDKDFDKVCNDAEKMGVKHPVVFYVDEKDVGYV